MNELLKKLNESWYILALIVSMIIGWTTFRITVQNQENRITVLENKTQNIGETLNDIKVDVAIIRTKLEK